MEENIAISEIPLNRPPLQVRCVTSIEEIDPAVWDGLEHGPSPFLRHGFLTALERTGSIGSGSGWNPVFVLAEIAPEGDSDADSGAAPGDHLESTHSSYLVGAVAAFVKTHSYGEYIFDWSWAGASERAGIPYYPKLVIAAPMTPATGRRVLLRSGFDPDYVTAALTAGIKEIADQAECSSIHWLFCTEDEATRLAEMGFSRRLTYQFHWHNRDYGAYDEFLAQLTSRKRKQLRKERRRALEHLDGPIEFISGNDLTSEQIECMDRYYRRTVYAHGGMDYLQPGFFRALADACPEPMLFAEARKSRRIVAGAFFMETDRGLYGRYWGCDEELDLLHFETAYYAGIERCIARKIPRFEAGAQGEHKLLRGFEPTATYSCHWLRHPGLHAAITEMLEHEQRDIEHRMRRLAACGPYKQAE